MPRCRPRCGPRTLGHGDDLCARRGVVGWFGAAAHRGGAKAGAAVLIEGDARLARTTKADGVQLAWSGEPAQDYEDAREILGGRFIVGAASGTSRHDAMSLAEAGADYVAFGLTTGPGIDEARAQRDDLVAWWGEIFEVPCVACDVTRRTRRRTGRRGRGFRRFDTVVRAVAGRGCGAGRCGRARDRRCASGGQ